MPLRVVALICAVWLGCSGDVPALEEPGQGLPTGSTQDIINGQQADAGQFPWMVRISRITSGRGGPLREHICGGSLIAPSWVLTAGHCVDRNRGGDPQFIEASQLRVVLGDINLSAHEQTEQVRGVTLVIPHPQYAWREGPTAVNDVALLHLAAPAELNDRVQTIALREAPANEELHQFAGWGRIQANDTELYSGDFIPSNTLRFTDLPVVPNRECNDGPLVRDLIPEIELCAGFLSQGSHICGWDSGSPLVTRGGSTVEQVGVANWVAAGCTSFGVFSRVSAFIPWIREQIDGPGPGGPGPGPGGEQKLPLSIHAFSGVCPDSSPSNAIDGDPSTSWNACDWPSQFIEVDLGGVAQVSRIRLLTEQTPEGLTVHRLWGRDSDGNWITHYGDITGYTTSNQWLALTPLGSPPVRYVLIETSEGPSWVSWREIEVFGTY